MNNRPPTSNPPFRPWVPRTRSGDPVEVVRAAYGLALDAAHPTGTRSSIEAFLGLLDTEVRYAGPPPGSAAVRGRDAVRRRIERSASQWESCRYVLDQLEALGEGEVFAAGRVLARGSDGAGAIEVPFANRWRVSGGLVMRIEAYPEDSQPKSWRGRVDGTDFRGDGLRGSRRRV